MEECKNYYENGQLLAHYFLKGKLLEGEYKIYTKNGELKDVYYWRDGKRITKEVFEKRELLERIINLHD
jgi:antitoxin component YwqK of YwqJK toxin-antitoxin module